MFVQSSNVALQLKLELCKTSIHVNSQKDKLALKEIS